MSSHLTVIRALITRDLMTRFGRNNLGFVWTVVEPMILCTGVMILWSLIRAPMYHGVPVIVFVLTGYMPLTMWRHTTNPLIRLLRNNGALLYHRPISHADLIVARASSGSPVHYCGAADRRLRYHRQRVARTARCQLHGG